MIEIIIGNNESEQRLDRFLGKYMSLASKGFIEKMIRKKRIKVNNKKISPQYQLKFEDVIQMYLAQETIEKFMEYKSVIETKGDIDILFEDSSLLMLNKGKDILTHGGEDSLINRGLNYLINNGKYDPKDEVTFSPACCNRLDRNTSGIVIIAKNYKSLKDINEKIRLNKVKKYYSVLVKGIIDKEIVLKGYMKKDIIQNLVTIHDKPILGAKEIITGIKPIKMLRGYTLLEIDLITGRTHQIRAHMKSIGHPVVGDPKYGDYKTNDYFQSKYQLDSQFLHAGKIIIKDYLNHELEVSSPLPKSLESILDSLN